MATDKPTAAPPPDSQQQMIPRQSTNAAPLQLSRNFQPITDEAAWALAERIKNSNIIPKDFIGKPENIFISILMGREVGLSPMQSVQSIMVVNGRPSMWGDALPALVYASNKVEKFEEEFDEKTMTATCTVRRIGDMKDHVQKFSWADAVKAGYDKKPGTWQTVPKRMIQMRARAFALRDKFADVLKGLGMVEEAEDYEIVNQNAAASAIKMPQEVVDIQAKAETFLKQEEPAIETPDSPPVQDHPQINKAKEKFLTEYKIDSATVDFYLAKHKLTTFGEIYPRLISLWKDLKAGKTTVEKEFGSLVPGDAQEPANDEMFL